MNKLKGFISVITAAIIFGFTPIMSKTTYIEGSNSIMLVFLRNFLTLPVLYFMLKAKKISLKVPKKDLFKFFVYSFFSTTMTALLLYSSYNFVSVGIATTVHYVYPIFVAVVLVLLFKEKISVIKVVCLIVSFCGMLFFFQGNLSSKSIIGIIFAVVSGMCYGVSLIYMDKSGIKGYYPFLVTFYSCIFSSITMFIITLVSGKFVVALSPKVWLYSFIISILVSAIATTLMQIGVKHVGPTTSAILCMFEPITSIITGIIFFLDKPTFQSIAGCSLIFIAVILLTLFDGREKKLN